MLAKAARKGVYSALHCLALGGPLPFADDAYAGIISAGVFTSGHVGVEGLDELVRICRPGGVIVLTVKNTLWDAAWRRKLSSRAPRRRRPMFRCRARPTQCPAAASSCA